jgi:adenylate cyclase
MVNLVKEISPARRNNVEQGARDGLFHFAGFSLDMDKGLLSKDGKAVDLRPKSYALLHYLVGHAGRVLSKDELLDAVWNDVTVTEDSLTQCIRDVRTALGDAGQHLIRTLPRRGYVFETASTAEPEAATESKDYRPSLAIVPFRNLGGGDHQRYMADGITEDIITAIARFSSLTVAGHHAVTGLAFAELEPQQVAASLGVDYVVDGSVRFASDRIRITAHLQEATSGKTLWADHYDRARDDIFAIQDDVVTAIATALDGRLVATGAGRARGKPAASWSSYDCIMQGRDLCNQHREAEAVPFLREALRRDSQSVLANAWLAITLTLSFAMTNQRAHVEEALACAKRALQIDDSDATAHWAMAMAHIWGGRLTDCEPHLVRAMQLNPANIQIKGDHANWLRYSGQTAQALLEIDMALRQDAFAPQWFHAVRGGILYDSRDYAGARQALERLPVPNAHCYATMVAVQAQLGDMQAAATALAAVRQLLPGFSLAVASAIHPYSDSGLREHLLEGLRRGGVPDA